MKRISRQDIEYFFLNIFWKKKSLSGNFRFPKLRYPNLSRGTNLNLRYGPMVFAESVSISHVLPRSSSKKSKLARILVEQRQIESFENEKTRLTSLCIPR